MFTTDEVNVPVLPLRTVVPPDLILQVMFGTPFPSNWKRRAVAEILLTVPSVGPPGQVPGLTVKLEALTAEEQSPPSISSEYVPAPRLANVIEAELVLRFPVCHFAQHYHFVLHAMSGLEFPNRRNPL